LILYFDVKVIACCSNENRIIATVHKNKNNELFLVLLDFPVVTTNCFELHIFDNYYKVISKVVSQSIDELGKIEKMIILLPLLLIGIL
jgi:hypothetical protein